MPIPSNHLMLMRLRLHYKTLAAVVCGVLLILLHGCSGGNGSANVNPDRAREVLRIALDHWKSGGPIDSLKTGSPPIVAQDFDWMAGRPLVAYEVEGEGKFEDINLRVPVRLTLRDKGGKEITRTVHYLVSTSPALTVFRDFN